MSPTASFLKYWLPVLLWMAVIFCGSADAGSSQRSSRFIGPLVRWLKPDISDAALDRVIFAVRKGAHISEYAVLAILLWRARLNSKLSESSGRLWAVASWVIAMSVLYAASDEFHQAFVPNRDARIGDILIDAFGAAIGMSLAWFYTALRKRQGRG